ncbi:MAG: hypothetical protein IJ265_09355 [Oscillospiraceae bacterium]|nr:hypothetical protein [Oscillospiraceae bacterium]
MTKKITAFLTAILCMASAAALPVSAKTGYTSCEWTEKYADDGYYNSFKYATSQYMYHALVIKTDGTALTDDIFDEYTAFEDLQTWEEFYQENSKPYYIDIEIEFGTSLSGGEYVLSLDETTADELMNLGRRIMLEHSEVETVGLLFGVDYAIGCLEYELLVRTNSPDLVVDETVIPEFTGFQFNYSDYQEGYYVRWHELETYPEFLVTFYSKEMTGLERANYLQNYVDQLAEKYSEQIKSIIVPLAHLEDIPEQSLSSSSVWTNAGDPNTDGEVNAADAAEMLFSAAQIGTGVDVAVTSAADVNADGLLNAEDAAAVLSYAAAKGTGADVSWVDILRK